MLDFGRRVFDSIINIGTHHANGIDEKAKIRVVNLSILHALISTLIVIWLITELKLYVFTYLAYICSLFTMLYLIHIGKFEKVRFVIYYITLVYLTTLSIVSKGELLVEYIIIVAVVIAYADFHEKTSTILPTISGLCCFAIIQIINYSDIVDYPLPRNKDIIFYINLAVIIALLSNALNELRREIYKYKDDIQAKNNELHIKTAALQEADTLKNQLFSIIGHDLRQPFNTLQGLLEVLEGSDLDEGTRIMIVSRIRNSNKNALTTLENLLQWGIAMQKEVEIKQDLISVYSTVETTFEVLRETAQNKHISLLNQVDKEASVWINKDHFELILRNLVSNAIKFSPKNGTITISTGIDEKKQVCQISIQDNGIGIKPEMLSKLFQKAERVSTIGTAKEKGTGLGLMLCKEFIEKNKGSIEIQSEIDKGTTVNLHLKNNPL